jgi:hypothetical protein
MLHFVYTFCLFIIFEEVFGFLVREKHECVEEYDWEVSKIRSIAEIICGEGELCQYTVCRRNIY